MNDFFEAICNSLNLGNITTDVIQIEGGLTNKMYKLTTTKGIYAIKILNQNNIKNNKKLLNNIELSEEIGNVAKLNNINAICAIKFNDRYIQKLQGKYFLVYNWCNGKILLTKEITLQHLKTVAKQLAILHKIKPNHNINFQKYEKIDYKKYFDLLKNNEEEWSKSFVENYYLLCEIYYKIYYCYQKLLDKNSYVHKDLNRKNIIWHKNIPYIIDWETATIGNPLLDFFNSAWFLTDDVDYQKYYTFAKEYFYNNNLLDDLYNASYAAIIDECNWLEFSLKRALSIQSTDSSEIELGKASVKSSLKEIINYYNKVPLMIEIIQKSVV